MPVHIDDVFSYQGFLILHNDFHLAWHAFPKVLTHNSWNLDILYSQVLLQNNQAYEHEFRSCFQGEDHYIHMMCSYLMKDWNSTHYKEYGNKCVIFCFCLAFDYSNCEPLILCIPETQTWSLLCLQIPKHFLETETWSLLCLRIPIIWCCQAINRHSSDYIMLAMCSSGFFKLSIDARQSWFSVCTQPMRHSITLQWHLSLAGWKPGISLVTPPC